MPKKRTPLLHGVLFGGQAAANEWASVWWPGGVAYCWTAERGLFPRPRGWGTKGKVYIKLDPRDLFTPPARAT